MFGAINAVTAEIMAACRAAGLDQRVFFDVLADSGAASVSKLFLEVAPKIVAGEYSPNFTVDLLQKDNDLAVAMLEDLGIPPVIGSAVELVNRMGQASGLGRLDTSALVQVYEHYIDGGRSS
jgi:3-hydroxyisobutyrate dehydrogenase-like beta-hydroxyacid dehydrogenase